MTDPQAKVLDLIRRKGGEVGARDLTTYQYRSVYPLVQQGYLEYVTCGQCTACKVNAESGGRGHQYSCHNERVRVRT